MAGMVTPLEFLKTLFQFDSQSANLKEVAKTQKWIATNLQQLGFTVSLHPSPSEPQRQLLLAEKPGTLPQFISLVSHSDTVLSQTEVGPLKFDSNRGNGAGIIDNKGGLAVLLATLTNLSRKPDKLLEHGLRVVISPDEELGSTAWHNYFNEWGKDSVAVLGFEPALDDGSLINCRRGNRWYNLYVEGIPAHSGRCRGEEINAAHLTISFLKQLKDRVLEFRLKENSQDGAGLNFNIAALNGGSAHYNVVCGQMTALFDVRFDNFNERKLFEEILNQSTDLLTKKNIFQTASKFSLQIADDCPPFDSRDKSQYKNQLSWAQNLCATIEQLEGKPIGLKSAGGAGDVNHFAVRPEVFILDGLGPVGGNMHRADEFLEIKTLDTRTEALTEMLPKLSLTIGSGPKSLTK